jgi:hypothetical protein
MSCLSATANAQGEKGTFWTGPPPSRELRIQQASKWLDAFKTVDRQVPTLSPSEAAWLKREFDDQIAENGGRYTKRSIAAMSSREYNLRLVRRHLDSILRVLKEIIAPSGRLRDEVLGWTEIAALFLQVDFWQSLTNLIDRKLVGRDINGVDQFHRESHMGWAQGVLRRVVEPFLSGELR